ncbi:D-erythronate 4-phosphate dehydrogenase [Methylobacterium crusticola]|uniref:D-erythronate 4-phosphate dehydrogenase n=1 Tax=Methylobacterium crusticola TaxID=1697972 RepID=A0ABQ4R521_9HYPH|nr:4-hydroxythreonine-4-phosphate dehydrogenase PdxA [Methylobacterium crusticola]GJD52753.1 D-erythronate 4-phosphate dehydrogenase [Methylobacterium crusticola]
MPADPSAATKPVIALAIGDPAGIGPELAARMVADQEVAAAASLIVVGDARVLARGAAEAGLDLDVERREPGADPTPAGRPVLLDLGHLDPDTVARGVAGAAGGRFSLDNFRTCLELAASGRAGAVCFTPFNKAAMRMAHPPYDDEIGYTAEVLGLDGPASEFNILEGLWNARVTSHVPLSRVAELITREAVLRGIRLTNASLVESGIARPRIAVAGLNPHAGDGGNFGREEIEVIGPAVEAARDEGLDAAGPYPPDTVFVRALKGAFDAVVTMYHDQGQIAMKLVGFDRGVTLLGGFPFPICTPAHGSAYDIAGQGIANPGASRAALLIAARMAAAAH